MSMATRTQNQTPICEKVGDLISSLRSDLYVALPLDQFVSMLNGPETKVTEADVRACIKIDDTVKIVNTGGREIMWLWGDWRLHWLIDKILELANEYGEVVVVTETWLRQLQETSASATS
jgi:hypothetical protein